MAEVGCAGILVADTFCGPLEALPQEGQLLTLGAMPSKAGGCAANVAIGLVKQGLAVDVVGCLGSDAAAEIVLGELKENGVDCRHVITTDAYPTSQTVILLVEGQDRRYLHVFGANQAFSCKHICRDWIAGLTVFYLGGFFAMPAIEGEPLRELLQFCRDQDVITVLDVVVPQEHRGLGLLESLLPLVDFFLPNDDEAARLTGLADPTEQIRAFQAHGAKTVVITCGERGAVAVCGKDMWRSGCFHVDVVDPSGAGDAFVTGLIAAVLRGWEMPRALAYASALGASAIHSVGCTDGLFTSREAEDFIDANELAFEHSHL